MKRRHSSSAVALVLGAAMGLPTAAIAAQHEGGAMQDKGGAESTEAPMSGQSTSAGQGAVAQGSGTPADPAQMDKGVTRSVANLRGKAVVNNAGDEIGEVDRIVRSNADDDIHAVVSVGGFLGIGDKEVTIPLEDIRIKDGQLLAPVATTEDELAARRAYDAAAFSEVAGDQMVQVGAAAMVVEKEQGGMQGSPAMAGGTTETSPPMPSGVGFGTLDLNRDGHLSKDEAAARPELVDRWSRADTDNDGLIDRAEFSAFEVQSSGEKGQKSGMGAPGGN